MSEAMRDMSLREVVEKHGSPLAKRQWEALVTVLVDYAIDRAASTSLIAGVWTDDARGALLDGLVPGRHRHWPKGDDDEQA